MTSFFVNGKQITVPDNWEELSQNKELFLYAISLFFYKLEKREALSLFVFKVLKIGGVKRAKINVLFDKYPESENALRVADSISRAQEHFAYIVDSKPILSKNMFPHLFVFRKLFAPKKVISQTGIWEFALAEKAFFDFAETNKEEYLDTLIAILFRRKVAFYFFKKFSSQYNGDRRVRFNEHTFLKSASRIKKLPFLTKWLIFRWFGSQREIVIKAFPYVFSKKEDSSGDESATWSDTIIALAGVGNEEKTSFIKLDLILTRINNENKAAKELERKNKLKNG